MPSSARKKLYIKTYGCQMNVYDSARMADMMEPWGYATSDTSEGADLVVLNTCHIREKAEEKVYSDLGRLRKARAAKEESGGRMLIAVGGCMGQAEGAEIQRRAPYVDMVFGPQSYHHLPDLVARALRRENGIVNLDFEPAPKFDALAGQEMPPGVSAFLSVQEGCDKFCTFCVVPYTRGAEYSRPAGDIVREARRLVESGALEITLLGQNVNAWHGEAADGNIWSLARLIREIAAIDGVKRIRYMTSHPLDMGDDLIAAHGEVEALMPFLHLPVQSGSDRILARMNRKHTAAHYMQIIDKLRRARPDIAFSSDFIVGFPGESDADFTATLKLAESVGYAQAYTFSYSMRPGTPAANDGAQLGEELKIERLHTLQALIAGQQAQFNRASLGRTLPVLFDRKGKREGQLLGKSPYMQSVHVTGAQGHENTLAEVTITGAYANSLGGMLAVGAHAEAALSILQQQGADA